MTLAARNPRRPRAWFLNRDLVATRMVISTPPSPVCPACFDDDWVAGHDGYLRASWLLAERCVCPAHGRMLIDQCPSCHAHVHVAFRLRENRARAVCARCEGALELGAGEGDRYSGGMSLVLGTMQARIAAAVDHAPIYRGRLEEVVAALWSALDDPGASRPVLTLWGSERGWRLPAEAGQAVGRPMPLGLLRVPFRALTLVALRDLFGEDIAALAGSPPERARSAAGTRRLPASRTHEVASGAAALVRPKGALAGRLSGHGARNSRPSRLGRRRRTARAKSSARAGAAGRQGARPRIFGLRRSCRGRCVFARPDCRVVP
jgi:hypothetical protein